MFRLLTTLTVVTALAAAAWANDIVPGSPQQRPVAVVGGTVYPVSGDPIADGVVIFDDGKITYVGSRDGADIPDDAEVIEAGGKRVYPGLFDADSDIGLVEIPAIRATRDQSEAGSINPNAPARVSVNPDSHIIPVTRANGVLLSHVTPSGGLLSGQGAVLMLDGWTFEDLTLEPATGVVMNWPGMLPRQAWFIDTPIEQQARQRDEALQRIEDVFDQAERYMLARRAADPEHLGDGEEPGPTPDFDSRMEAMIPLLEGRTPVFISANEMTQIQSAVAFAKRRGLRMVLVGGADAGKLLDLLVDEEIPVILNGTHRLPPGRDEAYDEPFTLPKRLHDAGIPFAIASNRAPAFARNLAHHAATPVAFGLDENVALAAVTLYPAQILGVDDRVGSLEEGKDATLIIADGDILDVPTKVTHAWIQGRQVDLTSKHTQLWEKYKQRYGQE